MTRDKILHKVYVERIRRVYSRTWQTIPLYFLLITLLVLFLSHRLPWYKILISWGLISSATFVFLAHTIYVHRRADWSKNIRTKANQFILGHIIIGVLWAFVFLFISPDLNPFGHFVLLLILAGLTAGTIVPTVTLPKAFFGFMIPVLLTPAIFHLWELDYASLILAILILIYMLSLTFSYYYSFAIVYNAIILQYEKDELITSLHKKNKLIRKISHTDELTQLTNRRHLLEILEREWRRAKRNQIPITMLMADIDFFKKYNDHYGHLKGDECLRKVANILRDSLSRAGDYLGRYGGEEFIVLLTNTGIEGGIQMAEKIQRNLKQANIPNKGISKDAKLTVSIGVATKIPKTCQNKIQLLDEADKKLLEAKNAGRNCIKI